MKVDDVRPTNANLLDTPRPHVTQPIFRPSSKPRASTISRWKHFLLALGLTGLVASPLPFLSSAGAHVGVMLLLAFGTVHIHSVGTAGRPAAFEMDTVVAGPEEGFETDGELAGHEDLAIREVAGGPLENVDVETASLSEPSDDILAPGGSGGLGGDQFIEGLGTGGGTGNGDGMGAGGGIADGLGDGGAGGGMGGAELFGARGTGQKFLYVIDRSESMNTNVAWEAAVKELVASLSKLPIGIRFQVIFYSYEPVLLDIGTKRGELIKLTEESRQKAIDRIVDTQPGGGTNHEKALKLALTLRPDVIFVLTDADDADPAMVKELSRDNRRAGKKKAKIHVIQFYHESKPNRAIRDLAEKNEGTYREISTLDLRASRK